MLCHPAMDEERRPKRRNKTVAERRSQKERATARMAYRLLQLAHLPPHRGFAGDMLRKTIAGLAAKPTQPTSTESSPTDWFYGGGDLAQFDLLRKQQGHQEHQHAQAENQSIPMPALTDTDSIDLDLCSPPVLIPKARPPEPVASVTTSMPPMPPREAQAPVAFNSPVLPTPPSCADGDRKGQGQGKRARTMSLHLLLRWTIAPKRNRRWPLLL